MKLLGLDLFRDKTVEEPVLVEPKPSNEHLSDVSKMLKEKEPLATEELGYNTPEPVVGETSHVVTFRNKEYQELKLAAENKGMRVGQYVRHCVAFHEGYFGREIGIKGEPHGNI